MNRARFLSHLRSLVALFGQTFQLVVFVLFVAVILYLVICSIFLDDAQAEESTWLHLGAVSYHFNRDKGYNEVNAGIGLEHQFTATHSIGAGVYRNSERNISGYAVYGLTPLVLGPVKIGALIGAANGYSAHEGRWFPVALPVAMGQWGQFGINLTIIPSIKEKIDGGIAMQFKWRF